MSYIGFQQGDIWLDLAPEQAFNMQICKIYLNLGNKR